MSKLYGSQTEMKNDLGINASFFFLSKHFTISPLRRNQVTSLLVDGFLFVSSFFILLTVVEKVSLFI